MTKTITKLHFNGVDYNIGGAWSLAEPTNLAVTTSGTTATITWTDPSDLRTIPPTAFSKSVLVRKVGSAPTSPTDWTVVVEETVRDTYKTSGYADTGLTSGTDYYYRVFTYATTWVASYGDSVKTVRERTFTVTFTETSSPAGFSPTYSDDASGLTAWSTDFDEFFGYSAVRLSTAWVESAEVTQTQSGGKWKLDITQLGTLTSGDNVMIKFPVRWVKMTKNGSTITLSITDAIWKESDGYQYYAFQKTWDIEANASATVATSPLYLWTYLSYTDWTTLKSWSGKTPQWNYTMWNAITYAGNNGTWYTITGFYQREYINALYMMKYWNPDGQTVIGRGFIDWNSAATATWWTNSQTNATYGETTGKASMKLFGLEDWRGNQNQRVWWMFTDASKNLWTALHDFTASINTSESQYKNTGTTIQHSWSYYDISSVAWNNKALFAPTATVNNWNCDTYWCDYGYVNASCLAFAGGYWTDGSLAGAFRLGVTHSASIASAGVGARLMFL